MSKDGKKNGAEHLSEALVSRAKLLINKIIERLIVDLKVTGVKKFHNREYDETNIKDINAKVGDSKYDNIKEALKNALGNWYHKEEVVNGESFDDLNKSNDALQLIVDAIKDTQAIEIKKNWSKWFGSGTIIKINKKVEINLDDLKGVIDKAHKSLQKDKSEKKEDKKDDLGVPSTSASNSSAEKIKPKSKGKGKGKDL